MNVTRYITYYEKEGEDFVGEFNVDNLDFKFLKSIFSPPISDPSLYNPQSIDKEKAIMLNKELEYRFDFNKYDYFLECYQA